jgi:hypothetical protein
VQHPLKPVVMAAAAAGTAAVVAGEQQQPAALQRQRDFAVRCTTHVSAGRAVAADRRPPLQLLLLCVCRLDCVLVLCWKAAAAASLALLLLPPCEVLQQRLTGRLLLPLELWHSHVLPLLQACCFPRLLLLLLFLMLRGASTCRAWHARITAGRHHPSCCCC